MAGRAYALLQGGQVKFYLATIHMDHRLYGPLLLLPSDSAWAAWSVIIFVTGSKVDGFIGRNCSPFMALALSQGPRWSRFFQETGCPAC